MTSVRHDRDRQEWLEADGLGGFASGTVSGLRTRRYHALLLSAATPPTGRQVLVAGLDASAQIDGATVALSSQRYAPDVVHPDGAARIAAYDCDPWPRWRFAIDGETAIEHTLLVPKGLPLTVLRWRLLGPSRDARLSVRLFLAGRDYHGLHHENPSFQFEPRIDDATVRWTPYAGVQPVIARSNGSYRHDPQWYRNFLYTAERDRGLDAIEDLAAPGVFEFDLADREAVLVLGSSESARQRSAAEDVDSMAARLEAVERRRRLGLGGPLAVAADGYLVRRGDGATIVAGYPWFTDWGRDTFIALRGLCLATGRFDLARDILLAWSGVVSEGMLPNRFPDGGDQPEFNAVDASLWFVVAAHEWLTMDPSASTDDRRRIHAAIEAILDGYSRGTRFGIRCADDGLLAAGVPGVQLTWMDARVGDRVITPRIGKPVEAQALWINALWIGAHLDARWNEPFAKAAAAFDERFWNPRTGTLYDVVDVDHVAGAVDASPRPNQIFAIGGLPLALMDGPRARSIVDAVERTLLTPAGLRSLAPGDPAYVGRYSGGVASRDGAYHQGTVWPWLLGPFAEAWVRTRGNTDAARREARARFLEPLLARLASTGPAHVPEVADGDRPHGWGGCPFQAWSVGELLRLDRLVLATSSRRCDTPPRRRHRMKAARA